MLSDLEIAQSSVIKPISEIARSMGLTDDDFDLYGKYKAKISLDVLKKQTGHNSAEGNYVGVTSMTPTPQGEGKTTVAIGLGMALRRLGHQAAVCLRQPSLGPVFGVKGGAAGGGYSQVLPMEDLNLHLTGDTHAVALAHNLLSAFLDNSLFRDNSHLIDPYSITWPRVVDVSDRALRKILIGLGGREGGVPRESSFDIAVASEVMAILALTTSLRDLRERLGRIVVGFTRNGNPVTAEQLQCAGAMTVLLKDAIRPNLLQTLEHTPAFVHGGPFGNLAHGNNSILADQVALKLNDYVVTETGFGSDLGMEKFFDIKCRSSGLVPRAIVLVATIRSLKVQAGVGDIAPGKPLPADLVREDVAAVERGGANLVKHIENARLFGTPVVVAVNRFESDSDREIGVVERIARDAGAEGAFVTEVRSKGGAGAISLAESVVRACKKNSPFRFLYSLDLPIKDKIARISERIYGADGVDYAPAAEEKIKRYAQLGFDRVAICMAKTHLSLSHNPRLRGRPRHYRIPVSDIRAAVGAGFLVPVCGELRSMPALPTTPAGTRVDIDENGRIVGLF